MNESLLELLSKVTVLHLIVALTLIGIIVKILSLQRGKIFNHLNKWRKKKNDEEDFNSLVYELKDSVEELKQSVNEIKLKQNNDAEKISELIQTVEEIDRRDCETERAKIKARITGIYGECHPNMICTDMQYQTLVELISEYEKHGGENSYVHSTVEPEMNTWKRINWIKG